MKKNHPKKIMFLSEKSILDFDSGAALELMSWFRILTAAGNKCNSFSFSCFDNVDYPVKSLISNEIDLERDHGRLCELTVDEIQHTLLLTKSTDTSKLNQDDIMAFHMNAKLVIDKIEPDFVICFGSRYLAPLVRYAREKKAKVIFYLASGTYTEEEMPVFEAVNQIVVPTNTLKTLYKDKLGLSSIVLSTAPNHQFERSSKDLPILAANRKEKFVTMINPAGPKGGLVFINVANQYQKIDPSITFLAVESRGKMTAWQESGIETTAIKNLWWIPKQANIEHVFRKTSILIVPSITYEAAGKVISEAMLCGIPVIASDIGGIKEQMRGAGELVDIPQEVIDNPGVMPVEYINTWVGKVQKLLENEDEYLEASRKSLSKSKVYSMQRVSKEVLKLFDCI